jgi:hypothetical protein
MKIEKILKQQELVSLKMEKLERREKMLKEKERKIQTKKLIQSGELISMAQIEHLDPRALLGALLEIKEKSKDENTLKEWATRGQATLTRDRNENDQQLILLLDSEPSHEIKATLKRLKFKWNPFRREWYGLGKKEEIECIFKDQGASVKVIRIEGL